ncbi:MAG: hypothetical protein JXA96_14965 [Sedimentisphaerales bacterium]|nr:hypothetical protein [Sedimentisphaerales bacterium]
MTTENEMPKYELENIQLEGNKLTFEYTGYREARSKFSGTLEGNTITGMERVKKGEAEAEPRYSLIS